MKKFSIIIPNYNKGKYIKECLFSVFNQTIDKLKYEVIVVDDGSDDNSINIIKSFDVILLQTDRLMAGGARNKGLDIAKGEYIIFLDSDDYLSNHGVLERLNNLINGEDIIELDFKKIDLNNNEYVINQEQTSLMEKISKTRYLGCPTKCFKRKLIENIRFKEKCSYEDIEFTLSAMCKVKSQAYFTEPFFTYRKVENSNTTDDVKAKQMIDLVLQIASLYYLADKYSEYRVALLERIKNDRLILRINILDKLLTEGENNFRKYFPLKDK